MKQTIVIYPFRVLRDYPYQVLMSRVESDQAPLVVTFDKFRGGEMGTNYYNVTTIFCRNMNEAEKNWLEMVSVMERMTGRK